jgi:hypothetical protein
MCKARLTLFSTLLNEFCIVAHINSTKVGHGLMAKRMRRELLAREPQVSVVTQTIYASECTREELVWRRCLMIEFF